MGERLLLDVVLVGEDDDSSGVAGLHQTLDDLVKLSGRRLAGDLHRLSNANAAWTPAVRSDQVRPGQTCSDQVKLFQTRSDQIKQGQTRSDQIKLDQT